MTSVAETPALSCRSKRCLWLARGSAAARARGHAVHAGPVCCACWGDTAGKVAVQAPMQTAEAGPRGCCPAALAGWLLQLPCTELPPETSLAESTCQGTCQQHSRMKEGSSRTARGTQQAGHTTSLQAPRRVMHRLAR